jgi:hypothetical protein
VAGSTSLRDTTFSLLTPDPAFGCAQDTEVSFFLLGRIETDSTVTVWFTESRFENHIVNLFWFITYLSGAFHLFHLQWRKNSSALRLRCHDTRDILLLLVVVVVVMVVEKL